MSKKKNKNEFDRSLEKRHGYKSYKDHFRGLYQAVQVACILLLAASATFSALFFAGLFAKLGIASYWIGGAISVGIAVMIGLLTEKLLVYYDHQKTVEPLLGIILVGLIGWNVYGDFQGSANLGAEIVGSAPTDTKTGEVAGIYEPQIEAINAEIDKIEAQNFYWCGVHQARHKCDEPTNKRYVNKKEREDRKALLDIAKLEKQKEELRATMNDLLGQAGSEFSEALQSHKGELSSTQGRLQGASIVCMTLFICLSMWGHKYGKKSINEPKKPTANKPKKPVKIDLTKEEKKRHKQYRKEADEAIKRSEELQRQLEEQAKDFELLREELKATREAEKTYEDGEAAGK